MTGGCRESSEVRAGPLRDCARRGNWSTTPPFDYGWRHVDPHPRDYGEKRDDQGAAGSRSPGLSGGASSRSPGRAGRDVTDRAPVRDALSIMMDMPLRDIGGYVVRADGAVCEGRMCICLAHLSKEW